VKVEEMYRDFDLQPPSFDETHDRARQSLPFKKPHI